MTIGTPYSSDVSTGITGTAAQYNNLRKDAKPTVTVIAADVLQSSNDTQKTTASLTYVKLKEILLNEDLPACRIKYQIYTTSAAWKYARIYKNGVALGTEQHTTGASSLDVSEDFTGFVAGDLIQIYGKATDASYVCNIRNMRFYYQYQVTKIGDDNTLTTPLPLTYTASVTNQDP